jgi:hypothetical protein
VNVKHWSNYVADQYPEGKERWSSFDKQVGGNHYKDKPIQPIEYILANNLGFCEGSAIKYITRYKDKGKAGDIRKAIHYLEIILETMEKSPGNLEE